MKFIKFGKKVDYTEVNQINPIRWEICFFNGTDMELQSGKFKCKDFFNDLVAKYYGQSFAIYGFNTNEIKLNDDGVFVRVSNIGDFQQFADNVERVINTNVKHKITVRKYYRKGALLFIPRWFFENTYKISLASLLIRLCNYGVEFPDYDAALSSMELCSEGTINDVAINYAKKVGFNVPDKYSEYWWFLNENSHSGKGEAGSIGWIHNNGVQGWSNYAK